MENQWRTENTNSIMDTGRSSGYNMIWQQGAGDQLQQNSQVQDLLTRKPAVLIVEPAEQQAATPIVDFANSAGIPMIVADRAVGGTPGQGMFKTLITVNWENVGTELGKAAVNTLKAKTGKAEGNIVELAGVIGSSPQIGMDKGFKSVISAYPGIKIVAVQDGKNERAPGLQIMEDFLTRYPKGQIQLVWGQNDEMGLGALKAIQAAGRTELVGSIITKDATLAGIQAVVNGDFATVCSNSPYFGPIIMPYVDKLLKGESIPAVVDKPFTCFENLTDAGKTDVAKMLADMQANSSKFATR
jgi:ABC-type sugar transport system substrate-binding protein